MSRTAHASAASPQNPTAVETPFRRLLLDAFERHLVGGRVVFATEASSVSVGSEQGIQLTVRVHNEDFFRRVLCFGNLGLGEAYMAREFDVDDGQLAELLTLLARSSLDRKLRQDFRFVLSYGRIQLLNLFRSKASNVRRHYDTGEDLFDAFLEDRYQVYSCGYAHSWEDSADTLQQNKLDRICRKLTLGPGQRLLDIGCGKGGLLIHAALHYGATGTGITNSPAHQKRALERIHELGLDDRIEIRLGDFSEVEGRYDRIASVGMLEHVPPAEIRRYFKKIKESLSAKGWALVHAIGLNAAQNRHDPFIQKYIFPGSDTPRLSVLARNIEANDLAIFDVENVARHYAVTCRRWLEAFRRNQDLLDPSRYDVSFRRMWEYYLCCGIAVALAGNLSVYQVLFTNDYHGLYPFQRV
jgi:cyclopropane-fatty-acyl-phospholipid synthase